MLKRSIFIVVVLFCCQTIVAKPIGPFKGLLLPETLKVSVGRIVPLALTIETALPFEVVEVTLKLPPGIVLVEGEPVIKIEGLKAGEKKKIKYKVRVKEKGEQQIIVTARALGLGPHEAFGKTFISVVNPAPPNPDVIMTDSDGTKTVVTTVPKK